jgi:alkylhydroperoxidase family enzyme
MYWVLNGYLDFNDEQAPRVREELTRYQQWHRVQQLPVINRLLQKSQQLIQTDVAQEAVCSLVSDVHKQLGFMLVQAEPALLRVAELVQPAQLAHLERKWASANADWRKEWMPPTPAERLNRRVRLSVERYENLYGSLSDAQRARVRGQLERSVYDVRISLVERLRRQQDLAQLLSRLSASPGLPALEAGHARSLVHAFIERLWVSPDAVYQQQFETLLREGCSGFAELHNTTTPAQRARAQQVLKGYEDDVQALMRVR